MMEYSLSFVCRMSPPSAEPGKSCCLRGGGGVGGGGLDIVGQLSALCCPQRLSQGIALIIGLSWGGLCGVQTPFGQERLGHLMIDDR